MPLPGYTHVTLVLDRSSSMQLVREDAIGGFNLFLERQRAVPGMATLTLIQFDGKVELSYEARPLAEVPELTPQRYVLGWGTALLDAVGMAVVRTRASVQTMPPERAPEHVVIAILTDGYENASRRYGFPEVSGLVTAMERGAGWRFLFLGAGIDLWRVVRDLGLPQETTVPFQRTSVGTSRAFREISEFVTATRVERRRAPADESDDDDDIVH